MQKSSLIASVLLSTVALAGCSTFGRDISPVMQIGKDSYTVRAISNRSVSFAKQEALSAANKFCQKKENRNVMLIKELGGTENETNEKFYDLTFLCLTQGDRDFTRITRDVMSAPTRPATTRVSPRADFMDEQPADYATMAPESGPTSTPQTTPVGQ